MRCSRVVDVLNTRLDEQMREKKGGLNKLSSRYIGSFVSVAHRGKYHTNAPPNHMAQIFFQ